jgi:rhomboid protease GluP
MFRKTTGAILCPSCGRITNASADVCLFCGRRRPGMWGFAPMLRAVSGSFAPTNAIIALCVSLYIASLLLDPSAALRGRGLKLFPPSLEALLKLGAAGAFMWAQGLWWTPITAIYLHGDLLHVLFNILWIRQLGPAVEELYGPARLVIIFTVAGMTGFALSNLIGIPFTVGASGSIFGLLGAMVAFGHKRGGAYGSSVLRQYGQFAVVLFILGLLPGTSINNWAHGGGFAGGLLAGLVLAAADYRGETESERLIALALAGLTVVAFGLAIWVAVTGV